MTGYRNGARNVVKEGWCDDSAASALSGNEVEVLC